MATVERVCALSPAPCGLRLSRSRARRTRRRPVRGERGAARHRASGRVATRARRPRTAGLPCSDTGIANSAPQRHGHQLSRRETHRPTAAAASRHPGFTPVLKALQRSRDIRCGALTATRPASGPQSARRRPSRAAVLLVSPRMGWRVPRRLSVVRRPTSHHVRGASWPTPRFRPGRRPADLRRPIQVPGSAQHHAREGIPRHVAAPRYRRSRRQR